MNKKAFTLVELLAVIIIIGLIAVITLPKISDSLENSKKNLSTTSAQGYTKTIDEYILKKQINKEKLNLSGTYNINENGDLYNESNEYELEYKGKKPTNGTLTYIDNELQSGCITINKYKVTIENGEVINTEKGNCVYTRIQSRKDVVFALVDDYIEEFENTEISSSGLYIVTNINNSINNFEEYPTDGWIKIKYKETGEITVLDYSLKFGNEIVNLENSQKTLVKQLKQEPVRNCPDPQCSIDDRYGIKITFEHLNANEYICYVYNNERYCLQSGVNETSPSPIYDKNKEILDSIFETCSLNVTTNNYTCNATENDISIENTINKNGNTKIYLWKENGESWDCNNTTSYCSITGPWDE